MNRKSLNWIIIVAAIFLSFSVWRVNELEGEIRQLNDRLRIEKQENQALKEELETIGTQGTLVPEPEGPKAYLTFDDGPHENTDKILDILAEYDIKATFFVNGKETEDAYKTYRRIINEGHLMANHTFSHKYKEIYASVDAFMTEVRQLEDLIYEQIGYTMPKVIRLPGGSNNTIVTNAVRMQLLKALDQEGYRYFDWNVSGEDSIRKGISAEAIYDQVLASTKGKKDVVILLHSGAIAQGTIKALPAILDYYLKEGYNFYTLDEEDAPEMMFITP